MEVSKTKEQLLKKRDELLLIISDYGLIIESCAFYSMKALENEVEGLEKQLKYLQNNSVILPNR